MPACQERPGFGLVKSGMYFLTAFEVLDCDEWPVSAAGCAALHGTAQVLGSDSPSAMGSALQLTPARPDRPHGKGATSAASHGGFLPVVTDPMARAGGDSSAEE